MTENKAKVQPEIRDTESTEDADLDLTKPSISDWVRAFLAIFIVVNGIYAIILAWAVRGISDAESMAALFLGLIGAVTGYYFGQRGVDKAQKSAEIANMQRRVTELSTENLDQFKEQVEKYKEQGKRLRSQSSKMKDKIKEYKGLVGELSVALKEVQMEIASNDKPDNP